MNPNELITFFKRDLNKLIAELELYNDEEHIWQVEKGISNSAGNLALHLIGNLHTFIGKEIGKTGYIRNRELEFTQKDVPRGELIVSVQGTIKMIEDSLSPLTERDLKEEYPIMKFPNVETIEYLLVHLLSHLNYHLGQINYHRRLIDK
ncbi:DinB family protein [Joostella sp.]|uniref:DinB family protein n=1 Tax=Joostella sp. TaxID=2231138 RepID=UPI003A9018CE